MLLSEENRYAMIALIKLAKEYGSSAILIGDIASSENIQRFLENILLELKKLGYLGSKMGKTGGYYLLRKPEEITLLEIIRHFEGTIAMLSCVSEKSYQPCEFCKDELECKIRSVFKEVSAITFNLLSKTSLKELSSTS
jgi:Rrf2 family protein